MKPFKQHPLYQDPEHRYYRDFPVFSGLVESHGVIDESQWITLLGALFPEAFILAISDVQSVMLIAPDSPLLTKARQLYEETQNGRLLDEALCQKLSEKNALEWWQDMPLSNRIDKCRDVEISIFAARHDNPPTIIQEDIEEMFA